MPRRTNSPTPWVTPQAQLANLGEFIGGLAVLVTLIYLALQVNQNTRTVRASAVQALQESASGFLAVAGDNEMTQIFRRGTQGAVLDTAERARFSLLLHSAFRRFENAFTQRRLGTLDDESWGSWEKTIAENASVGGVQEWWKEARHLYSDRFVHFVDASILGADRGARHRISVFGPSS